MPDGNYAMALAKPDRHVRLSQAARWKADALEGRLELLRRQPGIERVLGTELFI